uniref:Uncharacterized protein n=1 Tax=Anguilla anguilla TaxID=7936 RepID=A0A0E9VHC1_ANGAN
MSKLSDINCHCIEFPLVRHTGYTQQAFIHKMKSSPSVSFKHTK